MATADSNLSPYDEITSDELFETFMNVVTSAEQSFGENDANDQSDFQNAQYATIEDINGGISPDVKIKNNDIETVSNVDRKYLDLLPSNDPKHLPLLVKLCPYPIYEECAGKCTNSDTKSTTNYNDNNNVLISDNSSVVYTDNDDYNAYEDIDNITFKNQYGITTSPEIDGDNTKINDKNITSFYKTSDLDDLSIEDSSNDHTKEQTCSPVYAVVHKENKTVVTDVYAVVNKKKKSGEYIRNDDSLNESVKDSISNSSIDIYDEISNVIPVKNIANDKSNNADVFPLKNSVNDKDDYQDVFPVKNKTSEKHDYENVFPVENIADKGTLKNNEYDLVGECRFPSINVIPVDMKNIPLKNHEYDLLVDIQSSLKSNVDDKKNVTQKNSEYDLIENLQSSVSSTCCSSSGDNYTSIDDVTTPKSPDIVYNAEQIAYGFQKFNKERNEMYQSCIKNIERNNSALTVPQKSVPVKDKRNFFGFGKWKSTDDNSKSPTSAATDDNRKDLKPISPPVCDKPLTILCSGYLFKQGGSGFTPKNWRLRWFHLKKDNCLYYYKSEQDQIPNGAVILLKYTVSRAVEVNKRFAFKVSKHGARTYYFAANSEDEMKKWMKHLGDAAKYAICDHTHIPDCSLKNVSIPAISIKQPDCHGFLSKQGSIHKSWKRRYCVLKYGCLFYYEDMTDKVAIGVFRLHKHTIHKSEHHKNGFEAVPPARKMRTYYFYADTETDSRRWIDAMKRSISSCQ